MHTSSHKDAWTDLRARFSLPAVVAVLLISGLFILSLWKHDTDTRPEAIAPHTLNTALQRVPEGKRMDVDVVADTQLFGVARHTIQDQGGRLTMAPDTSLPLHLTGIVATDDIHTAYAIIRNPDQQESQFRVGDSIYGLATLEQIHIDHVIILRDGLYQSLHLSIEFMAHAGDTASLRKAEAGRIISDFRSSLINQDGMALIRMFGFEETYKNGGFIGFTVRIAGEDGARMLEVLGLKEGDVVTAVNGKRFSAGLEVMQSLSALEHATEVDVEVDRQGVPMFFHFDFNHKDTAANEDAKAADSSP